MGTQGNDLMGQLKEVISVNRAFLGVSERRNLRDHGNIKEVSPSDVAF